MKKNFIRIITLILAIAISTGAFVTAFAADIAAEDITAAPEINEEAPGAELIEAEITGVPFKNLIVFGLSPKTPEGITVELKYSDGTVVTDKIVVNSEKDYDEFYVNGELVEKADTLGYAEFGIQDAVFYMNDGTIELSHKYLLLPSILTIINGIF